MGDLVIRREGQSNWWERDREILGEKRKMWKMANHTSRNLERMPAIVIMDYMAYISSNNAQRIYIMSMKMIKKTVIVTASQPMDPIHSTRFTDFTFPP